LVSLYIRLKPAVLKYDMSFSLNVRDKSLGFFASDGVIRSIVRFSSINCVKILARLVNTRHKRAILWRENRNRANQL
jgi:EAL domain-containing protein (putative c-di-GMP-specific phosphodiesterase class I)